ncbi:hypothetical protein PIB30_039192 [Stylosanthes scabra]|uniref:G10 protein n=1 Tax=Stylosanthes scabra TaxID=79078 RepID=A0ABU6YD46_9FABA|nr:hypothetical protein [Stylosanthes scabra]
MREAENDPHDGKRKCETLWPIFKIAHQKSRYIFDLYHRRKEISKELYEFCLDQGYADRNLIAKWKKPGYERLCCLRCMQPRDHNFATTCVCRVPKQLREEKNCIIANNFAFSTTLMVLSAHFLRLKTTLLLYPSLGLGEQPQTLAVTLSHRRVPPPSDHRPTIITSIADSQAAGSLGQAAFVLKFASPAASSPAPGAPSPFASSVVPASPSCVVRFPINSP